jgi:phosphohistidine phosphatase
MVKRVTLLRHAKAHLPNFARDDKDRPLSPRGERDAPMMGMRLSAIRARPSLILTSPAKRATATARLVADTLRYPLEFLQHEPALYMASPPEILAVLGEQDDKFSDILLVGHNPGLTDLANQLLPDLHLDNIPTAGLVVVELDAEHWSDLAHASARFVHFDYPKNPKLLVIED